MNRKVKLFKMIFYFNVLNAYMVFYSLDAYIYIRVSALLCRQMREKKIITKVNIVKTLNLPNIKHIYIKLLCTFEHL